MAEPIIFDVLARDRASATFNRIGHSTEALETRFARLSRAATGIATTLVGAQIGKSVLDAADKFELSRSRLETITKNIGSNFGALSKQVDSADDRMAKFGFTSADTEGALASLEAVTKNPGKAFKDLALDVDIARGRNIGLAEATLILQRVETGHVAQLAKLGIATKDAAGHTLTQAQALQMLTNLYGGAASNFAGTFAGKQAAVAAEMKNSAAQIGVALLPAAVDLANVLQHDVIPPLVGTVHWLSENRRTIEPLAKAVLIGVAAWKAYTLSVAASAAITKAFGGTATATAAKVVAANAAEALSAKAATAAFATEGAVIGAGMAGGLGRGAGIGSALLRGAPRGAAVGALVGGQFLGGRYGNELSAAGTVGLFNPEAGLAVGVGAASYEGTTALLHAAFGDPGKRNRTVQFAPDFAAEVKALGGTSKALAYFKAQNAQAERAQMDLGNAAVRTATQIEASARHALDLRSAQDALRSAMHAAAQTAIDNGKALAGNSDAALANRDAIRNEVAQIFAVIDAMKARQASGQQQSAMLDVLTQAVEQNAIKLYGDKAAVDALLASLGLLPGAANAAARALASLPVTAQSQLASGDISRTGTSVQLFTQAAAQQKKQGKKIGDSFTSGYTPVVSKAAEKAAKAVSDSMQKALDKVNNDLQTIRDAVNSTTASVAGFADFATSGTDTLGATGTESDVLGQLKDKGAKLKDFANAYVQAARMGLDPHLLAQFASAGPDATDALRTIIHGGRSYLRQVNAAEQSIQASAGRVATADQAAQNLGLIHRDLQTLPHKLERVFITGLRKVHIVTDVKAIDAANGKRILS